MLILFDDGVCEELEAEKVRENWFRLSDTPLATSTNARRGDVVELSADGKVWRFQRVVEPSTQVTIELTVPKDDPEWSSLRSLFDYLDGIGGEWERACGGVVFLHVPASHADEVRRRAQALAAK